jgi:UDP-N-acetylglucosamine:LPS N-acetylglucosamine transferase
VAEALPRLVERIFVVHVTGEAGYPRALADRERLPPEFRERYRPHPFLRDDMLAALAAADLVVGRAGSSTLAEATALGLPMVVVPYPHAAGHQRANARALVEAGGARLVEDEAFDAEALIAAAGILDDPALHARMAAAARSLGRPAAAEAVARLVIAAAERRPAPDPERLERLSRGLE